MDHPRIDLDSYFRRIEHDGSTGPTLATLAALQANHASRIPFENLDVLLGRPIRLDAATLHDKLVRQRRGGYCFEHNTLFLHVLRTLGFEVTPLAARVRWRRPEGLVTPRTHMLLRVDLSEGSFLVDVGFGGATPTSPLALDVDGEQPTTLEPFRLVGADNDRELQIWQDGLWLALYRFAPEPQHPVDLELANWFVSTHPESTFVNRLMAARPTSHRRHGLIDRDYSMRAPDGVLKEERLADGMAVVELLEREFLLPLTTADRGAAARRLDALAPSASR
jgi:N-hydroxyarylamine O-acetyltransferase